jgi:hypothetical protein
MTPTQRLRLADRYAEFLASGRIEDLDPILAAAETDPELSRLIVAISRGDAEENGTALSSEERDRVTSRLAAQVASAAGAASDTEAPGTRTFLVTLRDETGKPMRQAAEEMDTTANLCDDVNTYWKVHADRRVAALRALLIHRAAETHHIPVGLLEGSFENDPGYALAAYAEGEIDRDHPTFEEILEDSGMTDDQQARWTQAVEDYLRDQKASV